MKTKIEEIPIKFKRGSRKIIIKEHRDIGGILEYVIKDRSLQIEIPLSISFDGLTKPDHRRCSSS